jgi:hypothetical protein
VVGELRADFTLLVMPGSLYGVCPELCNCVNVSMDSTACWPS